jgi:ankyrin repeat protein
LALAVVAGHIDVVKVLLEAGARLGPEKIMFLMMSATMLFDDLSMAEVLIQAGVNLNAMNEAGDMVLHYPFASPRMLRLLLKAGAKVDSVNLNGQTPLAKVVVG